MTDAHTREQDARFDSTLSWAWWPLFGDNRGNASDNEGGMAECIDGSTGFVHDYFEERRSAVSLVSTFELTRLFLQVKSDCGADQQQHEIKTLKQLRDLKRLVSQEYESAKELLSKHKVFRYWRRREYNQ